MTNDFVEYWAAARLLVSGGNPYSPEQLFTTQQGIGWREPTPLLMWNPPWTLSFIWPLGWLEYDTAQFIWFLLHTLIIFLGAQLCWRLYGGEARASRTAWLAVLSFAPVYFVLLLGQIGPLILLGLIVFQQAVEKRVWFLAGASLILVSLKPHLLYLLWLAVVLWTVKARRWQFALGLVSGAVVALGLPLLFDPGIYSQYAQLFSGSAIILPLEWATPSLGTAVGEIFRIRATWIRWLPAAAGVIWFIWYWRRHSEDWRWVERLPLILLVSVSTASFVWTFDLVVLLPALMQGAVWVTSPGRYDRCKFFVGCYLAVNAALLLGKFFVRNDLWYFWAAPALLLIFVFLSSKVNPKSITL